MSTLLYCERTSWLHHIHPLTKMCFLVWSAVAAFSLPWQISLPASLVIIAMGAACGAGKPVLRLWLATMVPLAIALLLLHALLYHPADIRIWGEPRLSRLGLELAARTWGRISFLLASSLLVLVTTHPSQILKALDAAGFSPGLSYLIASPLLIANSFMEKARAIRDAQQARGLRIEGAPWSRLKTLPSVLVPLVVLGLDDAHYRSSSLTARAFRALRRRTVIDPPRDSRYGRMVRWLLLAAAVLQGGLALWH